MSETSVEPEKSVTVAVRIRPLSSSETAAGVQSCVHTISDQVVAIKKVESMSNSSFNCYLPQSPLCQCMVPSL